MGPCSYPSPSLCLLHLSSLFPLSPFLPPSFLLDAMDWKPLPHITNAAVPCLASGPKQWSQELKLQDKVNPL